jgi:hypothetical protein
MNDVDRMPEFSLFGGPLHRLGSRLRLVRGETNTIRLGLALGLSAWGILVVLAILQGLVHNVFSMNVICGHVRLLVAIPLFFVCETAVAPRMAEFVRNLVRSGIVPDTEAPSLEADIRRVRRARNSWLVEAIFLLAAFVWPLVEAVANLSGTGITGSLASLYDRAGDKLTWVLAWYLGFCLPLFRFLMLRWVWHLGLWCYFLWRVNRLKLHLVPTHSDRAAGLGYLEVVHEHFAPLAMAMSTVLAASFAEEMILGTMTFEALYWFTPLVLALAALLFVGPLLVFSRRLWMCRVAGLNEYMVMAARYVTAFDAKWIRTDTSTGESQLGTADLQSLADLTNSVTVAREMRWVPTSRRLFATLAVAVVIPLLPLLLFKYPADQLAVRAFQMLTGQ